MTVALGCRKASGCFQPDLIIADYNLPDIDGLTAIKLIRERDPELPVLLVTGALDDEAAAEVVKAGADDYLRKDRMSRLPLAVEHAPASAEATKARRAAERIEAIGELTAGVAHDFNNLLQAIMSHLELVDDVANVPPVAREYVGTAIHIAEQGAALVHKLLSFARKHIMRPSAIQLATSWRHSAICCLTRSIRASDSRRTPRSGCRRSWPMRRTFTPHCSTWPSTRAMRCRQAANCGSRQ